MASVGFGTVPPAVASPVGRRLSRRAAPSSVRVPSATKSVAAAAKKEEKGLFDAIFGALYKEEQLLETDPILNKVEGKAVAAATPRTRADTEAKKAAAAAGDDGGGFNFGGLFSKKGSLASTCTTTDVTTYKMIPWVPGDNCGQNCCAQDDPRNLCLGSL